MSATSPLQIARGLLTCPLCLQEAMVRADTLSNNIPAAAGAVVREQTYRCLTPGCGEVVKLDVVSRGSFRKSSLRSGR